MGRSNECKVYYELRGRHTDPDVVSAIGGTPNMGTCKIFSKVNGKKSNPHLCPWRTPSQIHEWVWCEHNIQSSTAECPFSHWEGWRRVLGRLLESFPLETFRV